VDSHCYLGPGCDSGETAGEGTSCLLTGLATLVTGKLTGLAFAVPVGRAMDPFGTTVGLLGGGVVASPSSSGMGGQYLLRTCLRAGRRMGFDKKKSIPES
jgi:hypothetical protein